MSIPFKEDSRTDCFFGVYSSYWVFQKKFFALFASLHSEFLRTIVKKIHVT